MKWLREFSKIIIALVLLAVSILYATFWWSACGSKTISEAPVICLVGR